MEPNPHGVRVTAAGVLLLGVIAVSAVSDGAETGWRETGRASWYGVPHHGRRTSSGEIFDMHRLTAAHRKLPLGTHVRVTNLRNGRSVDVRVNDRGPYIAGRIIDLSRAAAEAVGAVRDGVVPVEIEVLAVPGGVAAREKN